jgi:hypothetical protein
LARCIDASWMNDMSNTNVVTNAAVVPDPVPFKTGSPNRAGLVDVPYPSELLFCATNHLLCYLCDVLLEGSATCTKLGHH